MCVATVEKALVSEASKIAWESTRVAGIRNEYKRKRMANDLATKAAGLTLSLVKSGQEEAALEVGMTATYLFHVGEHYGQVLECVEALGERAKDTRLEEDIAYYTDSAKSQMKSPDLSRKGGRLTALYSLIWEKRVVGTTEAMKEMAKRFGNPISNPTVNSYSRILHHEKRITRLGGPTGYQIEMFPDLAVALSRRFSYGKTAFFRGRLVEMGPKAFRRLWERDFHHRRIYEIENGNDPRAFAILTPQLEYKEARMLGETIAADGVGVLGELHPLMEMHRFGFEPLRDIPMADFLVNCSLRGERGGWKYE